MMSCGFNKPVWPQTNYALPSGMRHTKPNAEVIEKYATSDFNHIMAVEFSSPYEEE